MCVCVCDGLLPTHGLLPGTLSRPADVFLPRYPGGGPARIALALAVVSPLQRRYLVRAGIVSLAAARSSPTFFPISSEEPS